jgi:hypothetical protein
MADVAPVDGHAVRFLGAVDDEDRAVLTLMVRRNEIRDQRGGGHGRPDPAREPAAAATLAISSRLGLTERRGRNRPAGPRVLLNALAELDPRFVFRQRGLELLARVEQLQCPREICLCLKAFHEQHEDPDYSPVGRISFNAKPKATA